MNNTTEQDDGKDLSILEIKKQIKAFRDLFGSDIFWDVDAAETKNQLAEIMDMHINHIQDSANDAIRHCEEFKRKLGLHDF